MSLARTRIAKRQHVSTAINESALKQRLYLPLQLRRKTLQFKTRKRLLTWKFRLTLKYSNPVATTSLAFLAHQLPQVLLIAERLRSGELGNVLVVLTKRRQPQFLQLLSKILTDVRSRLHNRCLGLRGFRVPFGS